MSTQAELIRAQAYADVFGLSKFASDEEKPGLADELTKAYRRVKEVLTPEGANLFKHISKFKDLKDTVSGDLGSLGERVSGIFSSGEEGTEGQPSGLQKAIGAAALGLGTLGLGGLYLKNRKRPSGGSAAPMFKSYNLNVKEHPLGSVVKHVFPAASMALPIAYGMHKLHSMVNKSKEKVKAKQAPAAAPEEPIRVDPHGVLFSDPEHLKVVEQIRKIQGGPPPSKMKHVTDIFKQAPSQAKTKMKGVFSRISDKIYSAPEDLL
jgi:hypothetical protein